MGRGIVRAQPGRRLAGFLAVYLLLAGVIGWRLVDIQVVGAEEYRELAQRQTQRQVALPPRRGAILDREGTPLAVSEPAVAVYADPRALRAADVDPSEVADELAPLLDRPAAEIAERLAEDRGFAYLARQLPRSVGAEVRDLALPAVGVLDEPQRSYPAGTLAAQVVGFAGIDGAGLSGVEIAHDDLLAGEEGVLRLERAPGGVEISSAPREVVPATPGDDLTLTLDARLQYTAERLLSDVVDEHDAKGASAVVLDVASGEVLAMASSPGYDPVDIGEADAYERRNRAVTDVFEPGSVLKAVTIAGALEEGIVSHDDVLDLPASVTVGGKRFRDASHRSAGPMSVAEMTAQSSNVGAIMLAQDLGAETLHDYLTAFGFGQPTELGFPGESGGVLAEPADWSATSLPTIAIGQGVSASLLQLTSAFSTIAGGGERVDPVLVSGVVGSDGDRKAVGQRRAERVISEETAEHLSELLAGVVEEGTGTAAAVEGYRVAGKTGTAQKPSETQRGYEAGAYIAGFAGFAPVDDPQLAIAVMVDEPQEEYYGGRVAAPVFSELMEFALTHRRVAPSEDVPEESETSAPAFGQDAP